MSRDQARSSRGRSASAVLVVGDDATAWTLGCLLARSGVPVECVPRVLGEAEDAGAPRFPLALRFPALELLDGLGLAEHLQHRGTPLARAEIVDRGARKVAFEGRVPPHLCPGTAWDTTLLLDPGELAAALRERFADLGGTVQGATMLGAIASDERGVHVALTSASGARRTQRYAFVVDTTGVLRSWLGVHLEVRHRASYLAAAVESSGEPGVLRSYLGVDQHFAVSMPGPRGACGTAMVMTSPDSAPTRAAFMQAFAATGAGASTPTPIGQVLLHESLEGLAPRFQEGRVFFAGRAAHVHGPPSVHGPNLGVGDAGDLAWRLARVVRGEAPFELLHGYGAERRAIADAILRATARKRRLLRAGPGASLSRRDVLLSALEHAYVRERLAGRLIDLEGAGRSRSLRAPDDAAIAARAPDAKCVSVPDGEVVPLRETTSGAHFTLLLFGRTTDRSLAAAAESTRQVLGHALGVVAIVDGAERDASRPAAFADWTLHDATGEARARYRVTTPTATLVRPDGQIAFQGPPDPARILAHLVANRWVFATPPVALRRAGT